MQAELAELLTNYGKIDLLWFDTDGRSAPWDQERTYAMIRKLQPEIVIDNRLDIGGGQSAADRGASARMPTTTRPNKPSAASIATICGSRA